MLKDTTLKEFKMIQDYTQSLRYARDVFKELCICYKMSAVF